MRSYWSKTDPKSNMTDIFIRQREDTKNTSRALNEGRGRDWSDLCTSQRMPRIAGNHSHGTDSP